MTTNLYSKIRERSSLFAILVLLGGVGACAADGSTHLASRNDNQGQSSGERTFLPPGGVASSDAGMSSSDAGAYSPLDDLEPGDRLPFTTFLDPSVDRFSTFAADVDSASYESALHAVENGRLPLVTTVRAEDFINYFDYGYPRHTSDQVDPFRVDFEAAKHPLQRKHSLLRVGIQSKDFSAVEKRPANLVFLVDTSGSMSSGNKLRLVKKVLIDTLDELDPTDSISIVTYAGNTHVALPPTPVSDSSRIVAKLDDLKSGGSTNGAGGIDLAYAQASKGFIEGGISHVILCTDGDFNVGPSSTDELIELIKSKRQSGITLTALGFGSSHNDQMMELVSNAGNGIYGFIASDAAAERYVSETMLRTLEHVAKDMKIQVEFNPNFVKAYRLIGYSNRVIFDHQFRDDKVDGGEVGAGMRVTALYDVVLNSEEIPTLPEGTEVMLTEPSTLPPEISASNFVEVRIRYKEVEASDEDPAFEVERGLVPADVLDIAGGATKWAVAAATIAEILNENPHSKKEEIDALITIAEQNTETKAERLHFVEFIKKAQALLAGR